MGLKAKDKSSPLLFPKRKALIKTLASTESTTSLQTTFMTQKPSMLPLKCHYLKHAVPNNPTHRPARLSKLQNIVVPNKAHTHWTSIVKGRWLLQIALMKELHFSPQIQLVKGKENGKRVRRSEWTVQGLFGTVSWQSWSTARRCPSDSETTFRMLSFAQGKALKDKLVKMNPYQSASTHHPFIRIFW